MFDLLTACTVSMRSHYLKLKAMEHIEKKNEAAAAAKQNVLTQQNSNFLMLQPVHQTSIGDIRFPVLLSDVYGPFEDETPEEEEQGSDDSYDLSKIDEDENEGQSERMAKSKHRRQETMRSNTFGYQKSMTQKTEKSNKDIFRNSLSLRGPDKSIKKSPELRKLISETELSRKLSESMYHMLKKMEPVKQSLNST